MEHMIVATVATRTAVQRLKTIADLGSQVEVEIVGHRNRVAYAVSEQRTQAHGLEPILQNPCFPPRLLEPEDRRQVWMPNIEEVLQSCAYASHAR